jgi:hypothetical protein
VIGAAGDDGEHLALAARERRGAEHRALVELERGVEDFRVLALHAQDLEHAAGALHRCVVELAQLARGFVETDDADPAHGKGSSVTSAL